MVITLQEKRDFFPFISVKNPNIMFITLALLIIVVVKLFFNGKRKVYLVDSSCYKPSPLWTISQELMLHKMRQYVSNMTDEAIDFTGKIMERAGIGNATYLPEAFLMDPPKICMAEARKEAEEVMFGAVDQLLAKTKVDLSMIGVIVVNCGVFNPQPSLSDMIVNKYKLKQDVVCYNLSGMGCTASLIAVGLAERLLQVHKDTCALIVSTENTTENFYPGNNRAMLLINCLFRAGAAAILLSNRSSDRQSSKYELAHTAHTYNASSDRSYKCIFQEEDFEGIRGITVTKDLLVSAFESVEANLTTLGPLLLPVLEQLRFAVNYVTRKLNIDNVKPYVPNFRGSVEHFYCHVGGKPVLDEIQKNLKMSDGDMEASRMTLYRWGNTSSTSIWYELAYGEAKGRIKKGERVWQIAFGSGFKCSSVIWRALRTVDACDKLNPWTEEIEEFPVKKSDNMGGMPYHFESPDGVDD